MRKIDNMKKTFIIAEAGVNHNNNITIAKRMVDVAKKSGADAIKFQTFKAEHLACRHAPKAKYQIKSTGKESQFEMLKKLELDQKSHKILITHCKKRKIIFLSTAFDLHSAKFLKNIGISLFKIPSGEITNLPYLRLVGGFKKKIILSTGMSTLKEVGDALEILTKAGTKRKNITVLHCNTQYPTPYEDVNLNSMISLRDTLKVNVGYSDHTAGIEIPIAAVALGAKIIEKHFTLDRRMAGPDHKASLEPQELSKMVNCIRNIEKAMGGRIKKPSPSEITNIAIVRKSIVASRDIEKGELFTEQNITTKRPSTGINPMKWDNVINKKAKKTFKKDQPILI